MEQSAMENIKEWIVESQEKIKDLRREAKGIKREFKDVRNSVEAGEFDYFEMWHRKYGDELEFAATYLKNMKDALKELS